MFTSLKRKLDERRKAAEASLREVRIQSVVTALELDGARAEVMEQTETVQQDEGVIDAFLSNPDCQERGGRILLAEDDRCEAICKASPSGKGKACAEGEVQRTWKFAELTLHSLSQSTTAGLGSRAPAAAAGAA